MFKIIVLLVLATVMFADPEWIDTYADPYDWSESTITSLGTYRGVSCDCADFSPDAGSGLIYAVEVYFWESISNPENQWDTDDVYIEIWNSDLTLMLVQSDVYVEHYPGQCLPVVVNYMSPVTVEQEFWVVINTERSPKGCPISVADNTPGSHSGYSEDISGVWTAYTEGDFHLSLNIEFISQSLGQVTWAQIKQAY